jgi:hypothetical protein
MKFSRQDIVSEVKESGKGNITSTSEKICNLTQPTFTYLKMKGAGKSTV